MANTDVLPQLLTIEQLAGRLGVSIRHIRRLIAERRVPYLKVGWFIRFDPAESPPGSMVLGTRNAHRGRPDSSGGQFLAIGVPHQGELRASIRVVRPIALGQETFRWLLRI